MVQKQTNHFIFILMTNMYNLCPKRNIMMTYIQAINETTMNINYFITANIITISLLNQSQ